MSTTETKTPFATIDEAIEDIRAGRFVVVVDDPDRENEGDLVIAAQFATPDAINFMATHARGLVCLCLTGERCDALNLHQMTEIRLLPREEVLRRGGWGSRASRPSTRGPTADPDLEEREPSTILAEKRYLLLRP